MAARAAIPAEDRLDKVMCKGARKNRLILGKGAGFWFKYGIFFISYLLALVVDIARNDKNFLYKTVRI